MPRKLISSAPIANTWRELCENPEKTFVYDKKKLRKRTRVVADISQMLYRVIRDRNIALYPFDLDIGTGLTLENLVNRLSWVRNGEFMPEEQKKLYKLSIFYIMLFLCAEVGLDSKPIKLFWERVGVRKILGRIIYALEKWEVLFGAHLLKWL